MPQWRKLHVKATESLDINDMPDDFTRLLWVMLPLGLDREGRGLDNPSWIKAKIMPLRNDVTLEMIIDAMEWYWIRGMIIRYEVNGREYFYVSSFRRYQGNTDREAVSSFPAADFEDAEIRSRPTHDQLASKSSSDVEVDSEVEVEEKKLNAGKKRQRDPLLDHPAIIAYREEAHLHIPITWRPKVAEVVQDAVRWKKLVHDWIGRGWNKRNISGLLNCYMKGGIEDRRNGTEPKGYAGIRAYMESLQNEPN